MCFQKFPSWIGIDLDSSLAIYYSGRRIGKSILPMVSKLKQYLKEGKKVRIFTARFSLDKELETKKIHRFLKSQNIPILPITNIKDPGCEILWDDIAVSIIKNTGYSRDLNQIEQNIEKFEDCAESLYNSKSKLIDLKIDNIIKNLQNFKKSQNKLGILSLVLIDIVKLTNLIRKTTDHLMINTWQNYAKKN